MKVAASLAMIALLMSSLPTTAQENVYVPGDTAGFRYKWISTEAGDQAVVELWPDEAQARNKDNSDVIRWTWNKGKGSGWAGWGMQWRGWSVDPGDKPISP